VGDQSRRSPPPDSSPSWRDLTVKAVHDLPAQNIGKPRALPRSQAGADSAEHPTQFPRRPSVLCGDAAIVGGASRSVVACRFAWMAARRPEIGRRSTSRATLCATDAVGAVGSESCPPACDVPVIRLSASQVIPGEAKWPYRTSRVATGSSPGSCRSAVARLAF
jgi:hypothetical protein